MKHSEAVKLKNMLLTAEDDKLLRILQMVERHSEASAFADVLEAVRPRLARLRPPRPCTLERLLVLPFEDLLVAGAHYQGGSLTVNRGVLGRILDVMLTGLNAGTAAEMRKLCADSSLDDVARMTELGARVWPSAAKALANPPTAMFASGDRHGIRPQMALALGALKLGSQIMALRRLLPPKPFGDLTERQAEAAMESIRGAARDFGQEGLKAMVFALVARARRVDEVMQIFATSQSDTPVDQRINLTGPVADFCVERAVRVSQEIVKRDSADLGATADALESLVNLVESIGMVGEGVHRANIDRAVADVGKSVGSACDRSLKEGPLAEGLQALRDGSASTVDLLAAEEEARKLAKMRIVGRGLGLEDVVAATARSHAHRLNEALGERRRPRRGDAQAAAARDRDVVAGARLVEIMLGAGAAMRFFADHRSEPAA